MSDHLLSGQAGEGPAASGGPLPVAASPHALPEARGQGRSGPHRDGGGRKAAPWPQCPSSEPAYRRTNQTRIAFLLVSKRRDPSQSLPFLTTAASWDSDLMGEHVKTVFGAGVHSRLLPCSHVGIPPLSRQVPRQPACSFLRGQCTGRTVRHRVWPGERLTSAGEEEELNIESGDREMGDCPGARGREGLGLPSLPPSSLRHPAGRAPENGQGQRGSK